MSNFQFAVSIIIFLSIVATIAEITSCLSEYNAIIFTADELYRWSNFSKFEAHIRMFIGVLINPIFHILKMTYWLIFIKSKKNHWRNVEL